MRDRTVRMVGVEAPAGSSSPQRIRWGAVFAGVVLGLALLLLVTALWSALAFSSNVTAIRENFAWYVGWTAVGCLFLGGLLAGWLSGVRGAGTGLVNGLTMWGLILIVTLAAGVPAIFNIFNIGRVDSSAVTTGIAQTVAGSTLWASFWTILGGFVAAGLGGMIGGAVTTPANAQLFGAGAIVRERDERDVDDEDVRVRRSSRAS